MMVMMIIIIIIIIIITVLTVHVQDDNFRLGVCEVSVGSLADESGIQMLPSYIRERQMVCSDVIRLVCIRIVYDRIFQKPRDPRTRSA